MHTLNVLLLEVIRPAYRLDLACCERALVDGSAAVRAPADRRASETSRYAHPADFLITGAETHRPAAAWATWIPARTDPVIDTSCGMSWATSARPMSTSPQTTLSTPGGRNSAAISWVRHSQTNESLTSESVAESMSLNEIS